MRSPFNLRSLLASALTLTLGRAAVVGERDCVQHNGWLMIELMNVAGSGASVGIGYVGTAASGYAFGIDNSPTTTNRATFQFEGCQGGASFQLYCTSCGGALAATTNTAWDANGEPDYWVFFNTGSALPRRENDAIRRQEFRLWKSTYWKWGEDNNLHPVTFDNEGSIQPSMNAWFDSSYNEIIFISTSTQSGNDEIYALGWVETS